MPDWLVGALIMGGSFALYGAPEWLLWLFVQCERCHRWLWCWQTVPGSLVTTYLRSKPGKPTPKQLRQCHDCAPVLAFLKAVKDA